MYLSVTWAEVSDRLVMFSVTAAPYFSDLFPDPVI